MGKAIPEIRKLREVAGLSRADASYALSSATGGRFIIHPMSLTNWEHGKAMPHYFMALWMSEQPGFPGEWGRAALAEFYGEG